MSKPKQKYKPRKPAKVPMVILSNERNPEQATLIQMLYQAFRLGQIGLITGMDPETGLVEPMIAGIEIEDGNITGVYPLARILQSTEEIERILIPDGAGNYVSNTSGFSQLNNPNTLPEAEEEGGTPVEQGQAEDSLGAEHAGGDEPAV